MVPRLLRFFRHALRLASAGPTRCEQLRLFATACWLLLRQYVSCLPKRRVVVRVSRHGQPLSFVVDEYSDLDVMRELFVEEEYDFEVRPAPEVILDAGANIGLSSLDLKLRYPAARIYCLEPDPAAYDKLVANTARYADVIPINVALGGKDETRAFYTSAESWISSLVRTRDFQQPVETVVKSLDRLITELGLERIDLLKLDVEGAEAEALAGCTRLDVVATIFGELHLELIGGTPTSFFHRYLEGFEISRVSGDQHCTFVASRRTG